MGLKRKTVTLTVTEAEGATGTESAEDWELEVEWEAAGRSPFRIYRVDIDDSEVTAAAPSITVVDEQDNTIADTDPTTLLYTTGEGVDTEYQGVFAFGPLTFGISSAAEGDVAVVKVLYEHGVR